MPAPPAGSPSARDRAALATLIRAPGLGAAGARRLIESFGSAAAVTAAGQRELTAAGLARETLRWIARPAARDIERDLAWLEAPDHRLIGWGEPGYPPQLATIPDPPAAVFVTGDPASLAAPQLAVVGSRNPTAAGREIAADFAAFLAGAGLGVASGLALGIDAAAHEGALAGGGKTVAVMATGPDRVYPKRHAELARRIADNGALVTEFPPGTPSLPEHFPRRNRIISGLALGTLVVEAALGSGSLITARLAAEQGREVFAIPGSILSPLARGCHALIRDGAQLVERPSDILEALGASAFAPPAEDAQMQPSTTEPDADYKLLTDAIGFHPVTADGIAERTGLTPQAVSSMLLILELQGEVEALPGARYARRRRTPLT